MVVYNWLTSIHNHELFLLLADTDADEEEYYEFDVPEEKGADAGLSQGQSTSSKYRQDHEGKCMQQQKEQELRVECSYRAEVNHPRKTKLKYNKRLRWALLFFVL